jgi:hypothetical protein
VLALEIVDDSKPPWIAWPGRWGDTPARHPPLDQPSPTGPCDHKQWADPKKLLDYAIATTRPPGAKPPDVTVRRKDGRLRIDYDFSNRPEPDPEKLVVTVNSPDEKATPPRTFTFTVAGAVRGTIDTRLVLPEERQYQVCVSTEDADRRPSESDCTTLYRAGFRYQPARAVRLVTRGLAWIEDLLPRRGGTP